MEPLQRKVNTTDYLSGLKSRRDGFFKFLLDISMRECSVDVSSLETLLSSCIDKAALVVVGALSPAGDSVIRL